MKPQRTLSLALRARRSLLAGALLLQLIPFGCGGQEILRLATPVFLDDTNNILDAVVRALAPLLLP